MNLLLPNPDFLKWFLGAISKAHREIVIVNYMATLGENDSGPVAAIADALIRAIRRRVKVEIVLEGNRLSENYNFYRKMKDAGADVWLDTSLTLIHTKAVLVDGKILCVGSHNITYSAVKQNEEMSLLSSDKRAIARFKDEYENYTAQRREIKSAKCEGVLLPTRVMEPLISIKRASAPNAYSLYLLLCRLDNGRSKRLSVQAAEWAQTMALELHDGTPHERITTLLEYMDHKLGILKFDAKQNVVQRRLPGRFTSGIRIPFAFWDFGWHTRLSMEAVHLYLAGENERLISPYAPWWRGRRDDLAKKYGFHKLFVARAQRELTRFDLLEILFETATSARQRYIRYMNYFRQNPFYDYNERAAKMAKLERRYPGSVFTVAQKIMQQLNMEMNIERIDALCRYARETGLKRARRVLREMSDLSPNSTRLTFDYAVELFAAKG